MEVPVRSRLSSDLVHRLYPPTNRIRIKILMKVRTKVVRTRINRTRNSRIRQWHRHRRFQRQESWRRPIPRSTPIKTFPLPFFHRKTSRCRGPRFVDYSCSFLCTLSTRIRSSSWRTVAAAPRRSLVSCEAVETNTLGLIVRRVIDRSDQSFVLVFYLRICLVFTTCFSSWIRCMFFEGRVYLQSERKMERIYGTFVWLVWSCVLKECYVVLKASIL